MSNAGTTRKKNKQTEKIIEMDILGFLRMAGFDAFKRDNQGTFDPTKGVFRKNHNPYKIKGWTDIEAFMFKKVVYCEVKSPEGVVSQDQRKFLAMVNNNGQIGIVARSLLGFLEEICKHFPEHPEFQHLVRQYIEERKREH